MLRLEIYEIFGQCVMQSSIIMAEKQEEWIESDECVKSCGLERMSFGLSTDLLLDSHFQEMLCSPECLNNCPNIIDLYISLAAGEGHCPIPCFKNMLKCTDPLYNY